MNKTTLNQLTRSSVAILTIALMVPSSLFGVADVLEIHRPLPNLDNRLGAIAPSPSAEQIAASLGATVRWNRFGTARVAFKPGAALSSGYTGDPATAARAWVADHRDLFGLSDAGVADLTVARATPLAGSSAHLVEFRQQAGSLRIAREGSIKVGIVAGSVFWAASSAVGEVGTVAAPSVTPVAALTAASANAGSAVAAADLVAVGVDGDWQLFEAGLSHPMRVRPAALAIPGAAAVPAYETIVLDVSAGRSIAYASVVDATSGQVMIRENKVQRALDNPEWSYFSANPRLDHLTIDDRILACWMDPLNDCDLELNNLASRVPWDEVPGATPSFTTRGNNAQSAEARCSPLTPCPPSYSPVSPLREYSFSWTNEWYERSCDPAVVTSQDAGADLDAAIANLFAMHNRIHDWSYYLGFTEVNGNAQVNNFGLGGAQGDPEVGNAQAGAINGGYPAYLGRDNANQITLNDGIPPITNMYLWQSVAGVIYVPCVDGDYDAAVIAHEYGHMIQNRMIDPANGITGDHGGAMGESWSDLTAIEYLGAYGYVPTAGENPFAIGAYITGKESSGIRNYGMNQSPLNFSNIDYDPVGQFTASPHANGEIWSATNFDIRQALIDKYDAAFPSTNPVLQQRCADNDIPSDLCPGNRRWVQIMHDAFLLAPRELTMVDARDAYLAADLARSMDPGLSWASNQTELQDAFARRGFGIGAEARDTGDIDPTPSFESASGNNATVTFNLVGADEGDFPVQGEVLVGELEAYTEPVADTLPGTTLGATAAFAAGSYDFVARADGYGHFRFSADFVAGETRSLLVRMPSNWASGDRGAVASGPGDNVEDLLDETEETNWELTVETGDIVGSAATVALAGGSHEISRVQISAFPEPGNNRFTTLRQFAIETCDDSLDDCSDSANYTRIYTSAADAFPAQGFRPVVPDWTLRSFDVPATVATHVRMVVLNNHCTGNPEYQDPIAADADPLNPTDCRLGDELGGRLADRDRDIRVAELQVFSATRSCSETPAAVAVLPAPDGLEPLTGDGDVFVDNCEDHNLTFAIANHGSEALTGITVLDIRAASHPGIEIHTPTPFGVGPLGTGCEGPTDFGFASFNFTANGLAPGDTIRFEVDITADQIAGIATGELVIADAETDFLKTDVAYDFETDRQGWKIMRGTWTHTDTPPPGAPAPQGIPAPSLFYMTSSSAVDNACDQIRSPILRLSETSTLSLYNQFAIEVGDDLLLGFYDRANVGIVEPDSGRREVIIPDGGLRPYNVPDGAPNGACNSGQGGWAGAGPGWLDATWSAAALGVDSAGPNGREVQIDVRNATDPLVSANGLQFDSVLVTDVFVKIPDERSDVCEDSNRRPDAVDDAASTAADTGIDIDVLANDSDPDGDPIAVATVQSPTAEGGTATDNGDGSVHYTPPAGFCGVDTFTYQICDDGGLCDSATVTVTVGSNCGGNGGGNGGGHGDDSDSDDFDSDGKRDDQDSDDDNDGDSDNSDSDDDNDGISDDDDSDRDNDGISDEFDSQSSHESQKKSSKSSSAGSTESETIEAGPNALLLIALAEGPGAENLTVAIYDPTGNLVATSVSAAGRSLATAVPLASGAYSVEVSNFAGAPVDYELTLIESSAP